VDTAKTAVGKQHVTLETALRGKGETVLSQPRIAEARIVMPKEMTAEALIYRASDKQVVAEVHKVGDRQMTLALPPSSYDLVIRKVDAAYQCRAAIGRGGTYQLSLDGCDRIRLEKPGAKGKAYRRHEHLFFELGFGAQWGKRDGYNERLHDFGFAGEEEGDPIFHFGAVVYYSPLRYLKVGIQYSMLDKDTYDAEYETFMWRAQRLGVLVRGVLPLADDWIALYAQMGAGVAFAKTEYSNFEPIQLIGMDTEETVDHVERHAGYYLSGGGGVQLLPWQYAGFFWQASYIFAPVIDNLLGDTHDSGGVTVTSGIMAGF
jgi:hypothetical protein